MQKLLIAITVILLFGCKTEKPSEPLQEIVIDFSKSEKVVDISDVIDSTFFKIVALETNANSLIGEIDKIFYQNQRIYIVDKMQKCIIVFDDEGRFLFKLHKPGRGAGEYTEIQTATVTPDNIIVVDMGKRVALFYDLEGNYQRDIDMSKLWCYELISFNDESLYYVNNLSSSASGHFLLFQTDTMGKELRPFMPFKGEECNRGWGMDNNHSKYGDSVYVVYGSMDSIFYFSKSEAMHPKYRIQYAGAKMPDYLKYGDGSKAVYAYIAQTGSDNSYTMGAKAIVHLPDDLLLKFDNGQHYCARYNKTTGSVALGYDLKILSFPYRPATGLTVQGNYAVNWLPAKSFKYFWTFEYNKIEYRNAAFGERMRQLRDSATDMDNPIVFIFRINATK